MKKILYILNLSLIASFINGCATFEDKYKPLYQAKPEIKTIKKN